MKSTAIFFKKKIYLKKISLLLNLMLNTVLSNIEDRTLSSAKSAKQQQQQKGNAKGYLPVVNVINKKTHLALNRENP